MNRKNLIVYLLLMISFSIVTLAGIDNFISYSQSENSVGNNDNFQNYETPNTIKIQYPINWSIVDIPKLNGVLFSPPTDPVGVIVQNTPLSSEHISDNGLLNEVLSLRKSLPSLHVINYSTYGNNNSLNQEIMFTFGNNFTINKVYQFKKVDDYTLNEFTFFADKKFFDHYSLIASRMLNSFVSPSNYSSMLGNSLALSSSNNTPKSPGIEKRVENSTVEESKYNKGLVNSPISPHFIEYKNKVNGMNFTYPDFFNLTENRNGIYLETDNKSIGFFIDFKPSFGQSLNNFSNAQSAYLENNFKNYRVLNSSQATIFDTPAQMVYFSYLNNTKPSNALQLITVGGDRGTIFTYFSPHESFNIFLPFIIDMIESIKMDSHSNR